MYKIIKIINLDAHGEALNINICLHNYSRNKVKDSAF